MRKNWAGNLVYRAAEYLEPASVDEARELIARSGSVRIVGTRHCFNDIADTTGTQVSLAGLPPVIEVSGSRDAVRVSGALRYGDLAPVLEAQGLALANLASLPHISIAGAVATGTHGSGDRTGSLASAVRAVTLLTADGGIRTVTRGDVYFDGAVVSLGALGAVLDVTLDVQPSVPYAQHVFEHPRWDAVLENLDAVTGAGTSVSIFSTWQGTDVADQIWVKKAQPDGERHAREAVMVALGAAAAEHPRHPILSEPAEAATEQLGVAGPWFLRLPHFRMDFTPSAGAEIQTEYLVPRTDAVAAIEAVRAMSGRIAPLLLVNEIRTVRADDLWLSSSYGTDAVGLHFTWRPDEPAVRRLLPEIEAALPSSARPHWGKVFTLPGEEVRARYPRWADFAALRDRLDPGRKFVNEYLERLGF
jgi:xylitol oxidase